MTNEETTIKELKTNVEQLKGRLDSLRCYVDNPGAWICFDKNISDAIKNSIDGNVVDDWTRIRREDAENP